MITFLQGMGAGAGLIIAIGAQNAFVLTQGVKREHNWLVAAICCLCDIVLIFLGAAGIGTLVAQHQLLREIAGWGGAVFLFLYGCRALKSAIRGGHLELQEHHHGQTRLVVLTATLAVTLLNPHVYLDTIVLLGGISGRYEGHGRYLFALGAGSASLLWFFSLSLCGAMLAPVFTKRTAWRLLDGAVWLTMWAIAVQILPLG